jgi:rod shape determining protein RodA
MTRAAAQPFERRGALDRVLSVRHLAWTRVDWHVLLVALSLLVFGLFFVQHMDAADQELGRDDIDFSKHLAKVLLTLPALALAMLVRPRWLRRNAWLVYGATLVLLALVPLIGESRNNARRWLPSPVGFDLQPSELAKLGLVIVLARVLYTCRLRNWSDWVRPMLVTLVPMALVALQPDLGTAMTVVPVALGMCYVAGAPARRILALVASVVVAFVLAYQLELIRDYQLQRIETWLSSMSPASLIEARTGAAFHTYHARVAIGNGGWLGRGLGQGVANEAALLPERDSDSVFAVIAEEAGFFGTSGLLLLYALLILLVLASASTIRERFSRLVVCGIGMYFAAHYFVNVGVNLGLLPMTGLTLPLFSTGGSSMLVTFAALGLALGLAAQREATLDEDAFRA